MRYPVEKWVSDKSMREHMRGKKGELSCRKMGERQECMRGHMSGKEGDV